MDGGLRDREANRELLPLVLLLITVEGLVFGFWCVAFGIWGSGFKDSGFEFSAEGSGFRVLTNTRLFSSSISTKRRVATTHKTEKRIENSCYSSFCSLCRAGFHTVDFAGLVRGDI